MSRRIVLITLVLAHWGCGPGELDEGGDADGTSGETGSTDEAGDGDGDGDGDTGPAVCGNGTVESGEECDDGNALACDACIECRGYPAQWTVPVRWAAWNTAADAEHVYLFGQDEQAWGFTALDVDGGLLWEQSFEGEPIGTRLLAALDDRVALLRLDAEQTEVWVMDEGGVVWSAFTVKAWSAARFGRHLAVVDAAADPPLVRVHDVDDGTVLDEIAVGDAAVAQPFSPILIDDWNDGLVLSYTDASNQQVVRWLDADASEVSTVGFSGSAARVASDPDGLVLVGQRGSEAAIDFLYVTESGVDQVTPSIAPTNFGVGLHAMDLTSAGRYAALIETFPDFGEASMHLETDGRAILDSRHFGYGDDALDFPCSRYGGTITVDAAYLPSEGPDGTHRVTKYRLVD